MCNSLSLVMSIGFSPLPQPIRLFISDKSKFSRGILNCKSASGFPASAIIPDISKIGNSCAIFMIIHLFLTLFSYMCLKLAISQQKEERSSETSVFKRMKLMLQ